MAATALRQSASPFATRAAWDEAYTTYLARQALYDADLKFGAMRAAERADKWTAQELERLHGQSWKGHPDAQSAREEAWDAFNDAEQALWRVYGEPLDAARVALLATAAPDLEAVQIKLGILAAFDYTLSEIGRPGMEVIAADVERLTGIVA